MTGDRREPLQRAEYRPGANAHAGDVLNHSRKWWAWRPKPRLAFGLGALRAALWGLVYAIVIVLAWSAVGQRAAPVLTPSTTVNPSNSADLPAAFAAQVAEFNHLHHCQAVASWKRAHPREVPARMVEHADGSTELRIMPWTFPAAAGQWVVGLCSAAAQ